MIAVGRLRGFLILVMLGYALTLFVLTDQVWRPTAILAAAILLLLSHFLLGTVWMASQALYRGNIDRAERLLQQIKRPKWLLRRQRAYYYFAQGLVHLHRTRVDEGERALLQALEEGLPKSNERGMAFLNLAHIEIGRENKTLTETYLIRAKEEQVKDLRLKARIEDAFEHLKTMA